MKLKYLILLSFFTLFSRQLSAQPSWSVNPSDFNYSMTVTGAICLDYIEGTDVNDIVGAFIDGQCRGLAQPVYLDAIDRYIVYLLIYSNDALGTINFKVYDASTTTEVDIPVTMNFSVNGIIGSAEALYFWSNPTLSSEANILTFSIPGQSATTTFDGTNISLSMPYGTDLTSLVATYTTSPNAVVKYNNVEQISGSTANDFSSTVQYLVYSADETTSQSYAITVGFANDVPSDIYLSETTINETKPIGSLVGVFSSQDDNTDDTHSYSFVSGTGDTNNTDFTISGDELFLNTNLDYAVQPSYSIRVQTDDNKGGVFVKQFTITVLDENIETSNFNAVNVFSPNNDGINEYWEIKNKVLYTNCSFYIYNSIGEIVFQSVGYNNNWDGTKNGSQLPTGTYYYVVKCPDCNNCNYGGSVSIIR